MNRKGQGALEYLLLIGGAVLIAAIVITLIIGATTPTADLAKQRTWDSLCAQYSTGSSDCAAANIDGTSESPENDCAWDTSGLACECSITQCVLLPAP